VLETDVLAGLNHPLLTVVSPTFLKQGQATYQLLRQGGYTNLVVYMTQQIEQFQLRGEEFAMQHLGAEDELIKVLREMWATMPTKARLETLSPEERLEGLSPEERLKGLTPEQLEHLRQVLEQQRPANGSPSTT
jgi:hypothetical protein